MKTTTKAHEAYADRRATMMKLIALLESDMRDMDKREAKDMANWGFVGSIRDFNCKLADMIGSLRGIEGDQVKI